jgi:hypothetical protein
LEKRADAALEGALSTHGYKDRDGSFKSKAAVSTFTFDLVIFLRMAASSFPASEKRFRGGAVAGGVADLPALDGNGPGPEKGPRESGSKRARDPEHCGDA